MRARLTLALMLMWVCSAYCLAGEYLVNEEVAYGLRVTFTEPVTLTYFGDVLLEVSPPEGESGQFLFSGAELPAWVGHGLAWTPTSARITSYEWLSQQEVAAIGVVRVPLTLTETFSVALTTLSEDAIEATITRTVSQEQVPFVVEYTVESPVAATGITWTDVGSSTSIEGPEARFVLLSNAKALAILLEVESEAGTTYGWTDELDFLVHNKTEIALDATQFVREEEIASVQWSAANGDPDDARTFPIADPTATTTTLVSEWPNVLEVTCHVTRADGASEEHQTQALLYFRDGTPFAIRSVAATILDPFSLDQIPGILDEAFAQLRYLGANSITTGITWWFGPPDEDENWDVEPIYFPTEWPGDPRGNTTTPEQLEMFYSRAKQEGFQVHPQLRQRPYRSDTQLQQDYWGKYYPLRITDEFLYGDGEGYWNMLMHYLPFFIEHDVDTVFLNAECGGMEQLGGTTTRQFFRDVIAEYRQAGFTGAISYAAGISDDPVPYTWENLDPTVCGIPWADMDYVAFTYYPQLASTNDASTNEMYENARTQVDEFIRPFSETYGKPVFVEDCYCIAFDGCAVNPLQRDSSIPVDLEESRRYHTAILRALAEANLTSLEPLIAGMTIANQAMFPESAFETLPVEWGTAHPYTNEANGRTALQTLIKVFYRDVPLEGGGR